ncbi:MAG: 50S ribosomal protein L11 methyltransferase [Thiohalomonadales bacterium]
MWQQLTIHTSANRAEEISELLESCGALAVTMTDAADQPLFEPALGSTPLWQQTVVIGLYDNDFVMAPCLAELRELFSPEAIPRHSINPLPDQDWQRICLDQFQAQRYGKNLWICPSWHPIPAEAKTVVLLDPGLAFGTGTHPTTTLCLEWLDSQPLAGCQVLDFGCGSGVLGLAALKLGAKQVYAIDIDPQAITATRQNAKNNSLSDAIITGQNDMLTGAKVDILLANILAEPLVNMAELLINYLQPAGKLVLSGILEDQVQRVIDRYSQWVEFSTPEYLDGWARLDATVRPSKPN